MSDDLEQRIREDFESQCEQYGKCPDLEVDAEHWYRLGFRAALPRWIPAVSAPIGEPCLIVINGVLQHITYMRDSADDIIIDWFEPFYFGDCDDDPVDITDVDCCCMLSELIPTPPEREELE